MPSYIWSGKDGSGQAATERVEAASPEEARDILAGRGWTELRLRTSEVRDFVKREMDSASDPEYRPNLTPAEEVAYHEGSAPGLLANWWKTARESAGTYGILVFGLAWAVYRHKLWAIILSSLLLVTFALLFPALHFWFRRSSAAFQRLQKACNWRRWNEVLACLEQLRKVQRSSKIGIGDASMARYRALALAGLGRLDEGVRDFTKAAEAAEMPEWMRCALLAGIYIVAGRYEQSLECYRRALDVATEKGSVCIDYAACLVTRFNRPAEARQLLAVAQATPLPDEASNHLAAVHGVIAVREGDFVAANRFMSEALAGFEQRAKRKPVIFEPSVLETQGYLALINAALGNKSAAKQYFAKSEKYLATIRMDELIEEYRARIASA